MWAVNRLCLVAIPGQQVMVILLYCNAHHAKSSPGNETFYINDNASRVSGKFSGFPLLKRNPMSCSIYKWCLGNTIQSTDELLSGRENVFCHNSNTNICKQAGIFQKHLPSCLLVCPDINDAVSHPFTV